MRFVNNTRKSRCMQVEAVLENHLTYISTIGERKESSVFDILQQHITVYLSYPHTPDVLSTHPPKHPLRSLDNDITQIKRASSCKSERRCSGPSPGIARDSSRTKEPMSGCKESSKALEGRHSGRERRR